MTTYILKKRRLCFGVGCGRIHRSHPQHSLCPECRGALTPTATCQCGKRFIKISFLVCPECRGLSPEQ